ncbi:DUF4352 domain-containing protein [Peribacillus alkalitolerans]|uniref:DUF4352 domain-containing protein n=1 Tax=Peribacillus alkalitolerans TaxID=1550385 RepID=UPI0013D1EBBC|nr:DUF4352 domain-containing protein [Peribacillus alkalitolerans]
MKNALIMIIFSIILAGCTANAQTNSEVKNETKETKETRETKTTQSEPKPHVLYDFYESPQVTSDAGLEKPGQTYSDRKGEITLKEFKKIDQHFKLDTVDYYIKEVKVLHYRPDYSMIDFFHAQTHDEEFDFIKVSVEIKNQGDQPVKFVPVSLLETNTGFQADWEKDIYLEELHGDLNANGHKKGSLGFILEEGEAENLKKITIQTSDVMNENDKILHEAEKIIVDMK